MPIGVWRVANVLDNAVFYREVAFPVLRGAAIYITSRGTWTRRDGVKTFEILDWVTDQAVYQTIDNPQVQSTLFLQVLTAAIDCTKHLPEGFFDQLRKHSPRHSTLLHAAG